MRRSRLRNGGDALCPVSLATQGWKNRYFVLSTTSFEYFASVKECVSGKPRKGQIPLEGAKVKSGKQDAKKHAFHFRVIGKNRTFELVATSKSEQEEWMQCIRHVAAPTGTAPPACNGPSDADAPPPLPPARHVTMNQQLGKAPRRPAPELPPGTMSEDDDEPMQADSAPPELPFRPAELRSEAGRPPDRPSVAKPGPTSDPAVQQLSSTPDRAPSQGHKKKLQRKLSAMTAPPRPQPRQPEHSWEHGKITRGDAEVLLQADSAAPNGTFLVRQSAKQQGGFAISLLSGSRCIHHLLVPSRRDNRFKLNDKPTGCQTIAEVVELLRTAHAPPLAWKTPLTQHIDRDTAKLAGSPVAGRHIENPSQPSPEPPVVSTAPKSAATPSVAPPAAVDYAEDSDSDIEDNWYMAVEAYSAPPDSADKIGLTEGCVVNVLIEDEGGWWYVDRSGTEGWVPADFLQPMELDSFGQGINTVQYVESAPPVDTRGRSATVAGAKVAEVGMSRMLSVREPAAPKGVAGHELATPLSDGGASGLSPNISAQDGRASSDKPDVGGPDLRKKLEALWSPGEDYDTSIGTESDSGGSRSAPPPRPESSGKPDLGDELLETGMPGAYEEMSDAFPVETQAMAAAAASQYEAEEYVPPEALVQNDRIPPPQYEEVSVDQLLSSFTLRPHGSDSAMYQLRFT